MKRLIITIILINLFALVAVAQSNEFTYQGRLLDNSLPPTANYDFEFSLWDALANGTQAGTTQTVTGVAVANGIFTVRLNFGAQFPGDARFLQIAVRPAGGSSYTTLAPRQPLTSTPYSIRSANSTTADTATNANQLGGVAASQYVVTNDPRMTDARPPTAGSSNYIQNTTSTQTGSNFNISGVGRAGTLRSSTIDSLGEYQSFGTRVLKVTGDNTALGPNAGDSSGGFFNTYLGSGAGTAATSNANQNTFAGTNSGANNTSGSRNSFFGARSGLSTVSGSVNTFIGDGAGVSNDIGAENSFFGADSGQSNSMGSRNSYFGVWAGGLPGVTDSTAIGYRAFATQNNSLILGSVAGSNSATTSPRIGIGTTAPGFKLHLIDASNSGIRVQTDTPGGTVASFGGFGLFGVDAPGITAGRFSILENGNVGIGTNTPTERLQVNGNASISGTISGNGSGLTNLNASNVASGTLPDTRLSSNVALRNGANTFTADQTINGNVSISGTISGSGSGLTNLNASNVASGTLPDANLSSNVALRNAANTFTAAQTINANLTQSGTTTSLTLLNGFVTSGFLGFGSIPATGAGTRMMFYPRKAAFRAGSVNSTQWDDAIIGVFSTATGYNTTASDDYSTAMGRQTTASGFASTAMGNDTTASGISSTAMGNSTVVSGDFSTAMGRQTAASGDYSTAMGRSASTNSFAGSFVYGDNSTGVLVNASAADQWTIRAAGGYRFFTNAGLTTGVTLSAGGGAWASVSDRNAKDNINPISPRDILRGVLRLPISTWNYKGQPQFRHIGAMAQDFYSTFNVGENDKTITTVDPDGVALAAIQGLNEELKDRDLKIEQLQLQLNALKKLVCAQNPTAEICKEEK